MQEVGKKKPDFSLLLDLSDAIRCVVEVLEYGANKYERSGYKKIDDAVEQYSAAALRHLFNGNLTSRDKETNFLHVAHFATDALILLDAVIRELEEESK